MSKGFFEMLPEGAFEPQGGGRMRLHGGKGGDTPAPDPQLVKAQIRSMGYQDDAVQRIMQQSEDMLPLQKEQLQFGLDASRTAYSQSQDDRNWMMSRRDQLSGMQNTLAADAYNFNTEERSSQLRGEAYADVNQAFGSARDQGMRAMGRMGVNPSSGRSAALNNQLAVAQAAATASAGHKVNTAARAEGYALTDRAANALAGYPAMGMQATGAGAGYGASGLALANQGLAGMNSGAGQASGVAGAMGQNATGMFNQQSSAYQSAQQAESSATGSMVGAGAGIAVALI